MSRPVPSKTKDPSELKTAFGTVIVEGPPGDPSLKRERPAAISRETLLAVTCGIVAAIICLVQLANVSKLFNPYQPLTADFAKPLVLGVALALIGLIGAAAALPTRLLHLPVTLAGAFTGLALLATFTLGGQAWSFAAALLTFSAAWVVGAWVLRLLRTPVLAAIPPVAWLAGAGVIGLFLEFTGRMGWLRWWSVGVAVFGVGAFGLYRLGKQGRQLFGAARAAVTESRLAAGSAAVIVLMLGLASIWTAAPEIQFDALYFKAWLPMHWAHTGEIEPLRDHVWLNLHGFSQELAIPGQLFAAHAVGRYMQWLAVGFLAVSFWWFLRPRTRWAPLVGALVAVTPPLFWQATTAYDDGVLVLAGVSFAIAVVAVLEHPQQGALWEGVAIGALAGACLDLKLNLVWVVVGLGLAYVLVRPERKLLALAGVLVGAVLVGAPPLIVRWVDIGNPVFPVLGSIFHSPYWVYIPKGGGVGGGPPFGGIHIYDSILRAFWNMITGPHRVVNGSYSLPMLAVLATIVVGVVLARRRVLSRPAAALLIAVPIAAFGWFLYLQIDRYMMPTGFVALLFLGLVAGSARLTRRTELAGLAALVLIAVALWPATIAQFWNVPGHDMPLAAALGITDPIDYERQSMPEREAITAFNADSAPGSKAVSFAVERAWLTGDRDLLVWWEMHNRLQVDRPLPSTPQEDLQRIRALGVDWAVMNANYPRYPGFYYLFGAIERYGELRWADGLWSLYHFTDHPRPPTPLPSCDDGLTGAKGCWGDGLDANPGYTAQDPGGSISRTVAVCPGELLTMDVASEGRGLIQAGIDFDGPNPRRGHVHPVIAGNTTARVGGTAPPGSTYAVVSLVRPPAGLRVSSVKLGRVGRCGANAG